MENINTDTFHVDAFACDALQANKMFFNALQQQLRKGRLNTLWHFLTYPMNTGMNSLFQVTNAGTTRFIYLAFHLLPGSTVELHLS
jgi:hypothetical protein